MCYSMLILLDIFWLSLAITKTQMFILATAVTLVETVWLQVIMKLQLSYRRQGNIIVVCI